MTDLDRTRLVKARERLASYADAINEVRSPLNRSLHDVLGRLAELSNYMSAPPPTAISLALDTPTFARLIEWAETLGRAWGPVDRSDTYLWRDLQSTDIGPSVSESRRRTLDETMASVQSLPSPTMSPMSARRSASYTELPTRSLKTRLGSIPSATSAAAAATGANKARSTSAWPRYDPRSGSGEEPEPPARLLELTNGAASGRCSGIERVCHRGWSFKRQCSRTTGRFEPCL